jgi:GntR family transcriptional regulator
VGAEQLLLGLLREENGIAAKVLTALGASLEGTRQGTIRGAAGGPAGTAARFRMVIDDASSQSIYEQIVARVQEAVATGGLAPGGRLPAVRRLADELDIAPGTVARAYAELERLGMVVTEGARGTRVAPRDRAASAARRANAETLAGLLRPVAVAAFHRGLGADDLRAALEQAMDGIFDAGS